MALLVPDKYKVKFAAQLASYIHELSTIRFNRIGRILHSHEDNQFDLYRFPLGQDLRLVLCPLRWNILISFAKVRQGLFSRATEVSKSGKRPLGCLRSR